VAELLGGQVKVRQEGDAVYTRLELDANVLLAAAANSSKSNDNLQFGSGGVLWTCSIFPLFGSKCVRETILPPNRFGDGHELTPDNLVPAEPGTQWRCRQCGADRAAAWRRKRTAAA
jgi:hypothetical protein